ncbi:MAG TPA: hypothetical protein VGN07_01740 [Steroidobacteraceae bacterium]|jgi:hypothetical protein
MSLQGSPTLELDLGHCRAATALAVGCTVFAAVAPFLSFLAVASAANVTADNLSLRVTAAISLFAAAIAFVGFNRAGWLGQQRRIRRLVWQADGRWFLSDTDRRQTEVTLRGDSRIGAGYAWLRWDTVSSNRIPPRRIGGAVIRTLLLVSGDVSRPELRRLLTRLRIHSPLDGGRATLPLPMAQEP